MDQSDFKPGLARQNTAQRSMRKERKDFPLVQECQSPEDAARPMIRTSKITFNNDLMQRLSDFLPRLKEANHELVQRKPTDYQIDANEDDSGPKIQLNLGLGVFEEGTSVASVRPEDYEMALLADLMANSSDSDESDSSDSQEDSESISDETSSSVE